MTRDQKWLLRVTSKPKNRWLKVLIRRIRNITHSFKYYWCNILYKLHLLKRYTYESIGELRHLSAVFSRGPFRFLCIQCNIQGELFQTKDVRTDFFYTEKKGLRKIVHVVEDYERTTTYLDVRPSDIALIVGDKTYATTLPQLKVAVLTNPKAVTLPGYRTIEYDISSVRFLRHRVVITDPEDQQEIEYASEAGVKALVNHLKTLSLFDLEVK